MELHAYKPISHCRHIIVFVTHVLRICRHRGVVGIEKVYGEFYHENSKLPIYSYHPSRLDTQEIVNTLLDNELDDNNYDVQCAAYKCGK